MFCYSGFDPESSLYISSPLNPRPPESFGLVMNLYLCGMIGSGKTSIGKEIAKRLRRPFFDIDQIMEKEAGRRIHDIVAEEGWVSYREREYHIAKSVSKLDRSVVAMAGGTVRYEWNMDVFRGTGVFILLTAPIRTLVSRTEKNDRPRVNLGTSLEKDLSLLWEKYKDRYEEAADFTYRTDQNETVKEEAEGIINLLKKKNLF
jgi:shikimate kinase